MWRRTGGVRVGGPHVAFDILPEVVASEAEAEAEAEAATATATVQTPTLTTPTTQ